MCFGSARLVLVADPSTDEGVGIEPVLIPSEEHHVSYAEILIKIIKSKKRKNSNALSDINYDDDHDDDTTVDGQELSESNVKLSVSLANPTATAAIVSWHSAIDDKFLYADASNDYQFTFDSGEGGESPFEVFDKSIASSSGERKDSAIEKFTAVRTDEYTSSFHSAIGNSLTRKQTDESESTDISLSYSHHNSHRNRRRTTHETSNRDHVTLRLYAVAFKLELALLHGYVSLPISKVKCSNVNGARLALSTEEAHSRARCCMSNADIACQLSPGDVGLGQYWRLLAVVLEMLTITDSGALIDWSSSLGGSLLLQLYLHMKGVGDLQTYAVTICTFGGANVLMELLLGTCNDGQSKQLHRHQLETEMNYVLYYYSDLLHRWGEHMHAVEVLFNQLQRMTSTMFINCYLLYISAYVHICKLQISKFINFDCIKACGGALPLVDPRDFIMNVQVRCMNCRAEMAGCSLMRCSSCHQWAQNCIICEMVVRGKWLLLALIMGIRLRESIYVGHTGGNISICGKCGHGGESAIYITSYL